MCENTLTLRFEGTKRLELVSSEFFSSGTKETLMAIRGKSSGAYIRYGCFQWTSGVRAVCAAFIRFALSERNDRVDFCLIGAKGSLAASLDMLSARARPGSARCSVAPPVVHRTPKGSLELAIRTASDPAQWRSRSTVI